MYKEAVEKEQFGIKRSSEPIESSYKNNKRLKEENIDEYQDDFGFQCGGNNLMHENEKDSNDFTSKFNFLSKIKIKKHCHPQAEGSSTSEADRSGNAHKQEKITKTENRMNFENEHSLSKFLKPVSTKDISNYKHTSSKVTKPKKLCKIEKLLVMDRKNKKQNTIPEFQDHEKKLKG